MSRIIGTRRARIWAATAGAAAGLLALGVAVGTSAGASVQPASAPKWRIVKTVKTDITGNFSAIVATGKTTAWAFDGNGLSSFKATAWRENGSTWTQVAFPSVKGDEVIAAGADSPKDVWAFTQNLLDAGPSHVLRWNGSKWSVVATLPDQIADATVLSGNAVWVFGYPGAPGQPGLGVWFYNGKKWTRVSKTISGGSALSDKNVWGFAGTSVEHWNGAKWTATSVKNLLPPTTPGGLNSPSVVGMLAQSPTSVWALGSGNAQDEGGPLVVLHYNGHTWSKLASGQFGNGPAAEVSADGKGGLWLPMFGPDGGTSYLVHYASGKLTKATLPVSAPDISIDAVAQVAGSTQQLAGGFTHAPDNRGANVVAVILSFHGG
jgi:hypothetical protein